MRNPIRIAAVAAAALTLGACAAWPPEQHDAFAPIKPLCPADGTVYGYGDCTPPAGVTLAPNGMVDPGAPSKICDYQGQLFECPASYEVPGQ